MFDSQQRYGYLPGGGLLYEWWASAALIAFDNQVWAWVCLSSLIKCDRLAFGNVRAEAETTDEPVEGGISLTLVRA